MVICVRASCAVAMNICSHCERHALSVGVAALRVLYVCSTCALRVSVGMVQVIAHRMRLILPTHRVLQQETLELHLSAPEVSPLIICLLAKK